MVDEFSRLRSRRTFLAAEEGDPILFTDSGRDRKRPLEVTDVGGNAEDGYYLVVQGPRGGSYTIRERDGGGLKLESKKSGGWKAVTNLRFAEVSDSVEAEYRSLRDQTLNQAYYLMADDDYDYSEWAAAASDAVASVTSELDDPETRVVLMGAPRNAGDTNAYGSAPVDNEARQVAFAVLVDDITERGAEFAGSELDSTIDTPNDVADLVDQGVVMARNYVDAGAADEMDIAAEAAATILADRLTTSDHQAIIDFLPRPEQGLASRLAFDVNQLGRLVPWGQRATAYDRATAFLTAAILVEHEERQRRALVNETEVRSAREWLEEKMGQPLDGDVDFSLDPKLPKLPMLADGGLPHTMLDEATMLHLQNVVTMTEDWSLQDAGLVTNADERRMVWANETDEKALILASVGEDGRNHWWVWLLDFESDSSTTLYDGFDFDEAIDTVNDTLVDEDSPRITLMDGGDETYLADNVNEDELGKQVMQALGIGVDYAQAGLAAAAPVAKEAGSILGKVGLAVGKATGRSALSVWSHVWRKYPRQIGNFLLTTVGMSLLYHAGRYVQGAHVKTEFSKGGIDLGVTSVKSAQFVGPDGSTGLVDWEMQTKKTDDDGVYFVMENRETGEVQNVRPGEPIRTGEGFDWGTRVNASKTFLDRGTSLMFGKTYEEIIDGFGRWGVDVMLGQDPDWRGDVRRPDATGNVGRYDPWKGVEKTGPGKPGASSSRSSSSSSSSSSSGSQSTLGGNRGGYTSDGSGTSRKEKLKQQQAEREKRKKEREERKKREEQAERDYRSSSGISQEEFERSFSEHKERIMNLAPSVLKDKLGMGMSLTEAASETDEADEVPRSADDVEEAVGDADRADQLRHPNREEGTTVVVDEDDVQEPEDTYEQRREEFRAEQEAIEYEKQQEADDYYLSQDEETQAELNEVADEAERVRSFQGEVQTEEFDIKSAVAQAGENRQRRLEESREQEEAFWEEEQRQKALDELTFSEREGFFDETLDEQQDPADW